MMVIINNFVYFRIHSYTLYTFFLLKSLSCLLKINIVTSATLEGFTVQYFTGANRMDIF